MSTKKLNFLRDSAIIETTSIAVKPKEKAEETTAKKANKTPKVKRYEDGLWKVLHNEETDQIVKLERISSPLEVLALTRTEDSSAWGTLLQWPDPDGFKHVWAMPQSLLNQPGSAWLTYLQENGFQVSQDGISFVKNYLATVGETTQKRARLALKTGWSEDAKTFALPHTNIGANQEEMVVMQQTPGTARMYKSAGTLEEWKHEVAEKSVGNTRLSFMICAALTGPMLYLVGGENGGYHILGESSKGKSTALRMAASIYGDQAGHFKSWRTTDNAAESLAVFSNDSCLILDEIGEAPARACSDMAYMLSNGIGKARAGRDGQARAVPTWRTVFLSSGEITLTQKLAEVEKKVQAGQSVRVVEILADAGKGFGVFDDCKDMRPSEFSMKIKELSGKFYGTAGPAFIEALIKKENIAKEVKEICAKFSSEVCEKNADGQVLRVAQKFGLCLAAGKIAVENGILPHSIEDIEISVKSCFESWLDVRGGQGAGEDNDIVKTLKSFIELHGQSRFQNLVPRTDSEGNVIEQICHNRCGFRNPDSAEYYILEEAWKSEIFKTLNPKKAAKVLQNQGFLSCGEGDRLKTKKSFPGLGVVRCYVVKVNEDETEKAKKEIEVNKELTSKLLVQGELIDGIPANEFYAEIINGAMVTDEIHDR